MNFTQAALARLQLNRVEAPLVCVVDGDAAVREALDSIIRCAGYRSCLSSSAEEFLARPRAITAGCLLVDLHLPGMNGLGLQHAIQNRAEMPVIFMAADADVASTVQAMKAGAFEFLTKPLVNEELMNAIGHAIEHSHVALRKLTQVQALQSRYESLTLREREVMSLLITGRLNKQVGGELGISEITVKAHRGKMMRKMQAGSFAELINMAARLFQSHSAQVSNYWARGMNATPS